VKPLPKLLLSEYEIVKVLQEDLFEIENGQLIMTLDYEYQGETIPIEQVTTLRSEGVYYE